MGIFDEIKKLTHPYDDEDEDFDEFEETPRKEVFEDRRPKLEDRRNKVVNIHATTQLKVVLVKPERFENASEIADHLKDKRTVVLNLESTNKDVARRLVDFLSGVAYAGEGKIKKVAANTYMITPLQQKFYYQMVLQFYHHKESFYHQNPFLPLPSFLQYH